MILNVSHVDKAFSSTDIIRDATFLLNEHEKAAIVGVNGSGKTTLLNIISSEDLPDSGTVTIKKGVSLGYLHQNNNMDSQLTVKEELTSVIQPVLDMEKRILELELHMKEVTGNDLKKLFDEYERLTHSYELLDGYSARSRVTGVIRGLGFSESDSNKHMHELSGGQKTRVFLGKLLLKNPDIILLDEPTNHLDLSSIEWLESYLANYSGAVVIVSHDRYFLDRIVTKVIDIDNTKVESYSGNYTAYAEKKEERRLAQLKAWQNQQEKIAHQEAVIEKLKSFNREKSIKRAESREKMLDKLERLEKPEESDNEMHLFFKQTQSSGNDVLKVENISKSFGENTLFSNLSFELRRGEHVAVIGDNGAGKTTILKILTGLLNPDAGNIEFGSNVLIGYYDQEHQVLHMEKTLFEEISDAYPDMNNTAVRNVLAAFLFTGDDVFKRIGDLSGGERGRVSLAKLMLSRANLLVLDEPTNHLDMISKGILESAIRKFDGTVLYVSHDRYFINQTATRILDLSGKQLYNYIGNYDYYLEKKKDVTSFAYGVQNAQASSCVDEPVETSVPSNMSKEEWKAKKAEQARIKKRRSDLSACEKSIREYENKKQETDDKFSDPEIQRDAAGLLELQKEKEAIEEKLEKLYVQWEELAAEEYI